MDIFRKNLSENCLHNFPYFDQWIQPRTNIPFWLQKIRNKFEFFWILPDLFRKFGALTLNIWQFWMKNRLVKKSQKKAKKPNHKFLSQPSSKKAKFEEFGFKKAKLVTLQLPLTWPWPSAMETNENRNAVGFHAHLTIIQEYFMASHQTWSRAYWLGTVFHHYSFQFRTFAFWFSRLLACVSGRYSAQKYWMSKSLVWFGPSKVLSNEIPP